MLARTLWVFWQNTKYAPGDFLACSFIFSHAASKPSTASSHIASWGALPEKISYAGVFTEHLVFAKLRTGVVVKVRVIETFEDIGCQADVRRRNPPTVMLKPPILVSKNRGNKDNGTWCSLSKRSVRPVALFAVPERHPPFLLPSPFQECRTARTVAPERARETLAGLRILGSLQ